MLPIHLFDSLSFLQQQQQQQKQQQPLIQQVSTFFKVAAPLPTPIDP
ncbi:MAG: hypothetical protein Q8P67_09675 [archaeon]|nr:hypothetical protein [archaeon]